MSESDQPFDPSQPPPAPPPPPPPSAPPPPGYQQPPAYGAAPTPQWSGPPLAEWPKRAQGYLIDYLGPAIVASFVQWFISSALGFIVWLAALGWGIYNGYLNGQTGQSYGKQTMGLRLVRESDGQLIGGGAGIGRFFLHILDALPCYIGFLWPLWDAKKQTFADKIMGTVVLDEGTRR
jgi:uncharacterized RDD family membrane protein YckC